MVVVSNNLLDFCLLSKYDKGLLLHHWHLLYRELLLQVSEYSFINVNDHDKPTFNKENVPKSRIK